MNENIQQDKEKNAPLISNTVCKKKPGMVRENKNRSTSSVGGFFEFDDPDGTCSEPHPSLKSGENTVQRGYLSKNANRIMLMRQVIPVLPNLTHKSQWEKPVPLLVPRIERDSRNLLNETFWHQMLQHKAGRQYNGFLKIPGCIYIWFMLW